MKANNVKFIIKILGCSIGALHRYKIFKRVF